MGNIIDRSINYICCFTGNRPHKMRFLDDPQDERYTRLAGAVYNEVFNLALYGVDTFYTGCARGFDLLAAEAVIRFNSMYPDDAVILACAVPYPGHDSKWPEHDKKRFENILGHALIVNIVSGSDAADCFQKRNAFMVNTSGFVIADWNGERSGGTYNTMVYANGQDRELHILKPYQQEYQIVQPKWLTAYPQPAEDDYTGRREYAMIQLRRKIADTLLYENNMILKDGGLTFDKEVDTARFQYLETALLELNKATDLAMLDKLVDLPAIKNELAQIESRIFDLHSEIHGCISDLDRTVLLEKLQKLLDSRNLIRKCILE